MTYTQMDRQDDSERGFCSVTFAGSDEVKEYIDSGMLGMYDDSQGSDGSVHGGKDTTR